MVQVRHTNIRPPHRQVSTPAVSKHPGRAVHPVAGRSGAFLLAAGGGVWRCHPPIRTWRPDLIAGFGGFTTAGLIVVAALFRRPVALHEANRVPGRAIRVLGGLAQRLYLPPGVHLERVRQAGVRYAGLPVRREIVASPREAAQIRLGFDPAQKVLVILGGSQGASALNQWVRDRLERLAAEGIQTCCVTGLNKGGAEVRELPSRAGRPVKAVFMPFCDDVATLLSAADLVVSRAGAGTIAELMRCATPAILVPFPRAADNHQWANARFFEQQGGGLVVDQQFLGDLDREVRDVIFNDWLLRKFRGNLQRMDHANSLDVILDDLEHWPLPAGRAPPGPAAAAAPGGHRKDGGMKPPAAAPPVRPRRPRTSTSWASAAPAWRRWRSTCKQSGLAVSGEDDALAPAVRELLEGAGVALTGRAACPRPATWSCIHPPFRRATRRGPRGGARPAAGAPGRDARGGAARAEAGRRRRRPRQDDDHRHAHHRAAPGRLSLRLAARRPVQRCRPCRPAGSARATGSWPRSTRATARSTVFPRRSRSW